ncbi:major facilitator superfamily transporter [Vibrio spartinae]|uniref:Major facilitator superfamily transporter n=2 Tax=Vibrio spartinae TaxID=1918945 RepID=A0A1N6M282_9VIBR|nr:major facilitator superfamily transporter [Vibrio spartinae]
MGIGLSFVFTCGGTWPIGLIGHEHAGKIMSWVGIAMFLGLALGNYYGAWSYETIGLEYSAATILVLPLLSLLVCLTIPAIETKENKNVISLSIAVKKIWPSGSSFVLANVGYSLITSYLLVNFIDLGWSKFGALALSCFGIGYVISRLIFGWMADKAGKVSCITFLAVESLGLVLLSLQYSPYISIAGSFLCGFGLSMVYPLLAVVAINSLPKENIGIAISTYEACFDIGILIAGLIGSLVIHYYSYQYAFFIGVICCLIAVFTTNLSYKRSEKPVEIVESY